MVPVSRGSHLKLEVGACYFIKRNFHEVLVQYPDRIVDLPVPASQLLVKVSDRLLERDSEILIKLCPEFNNLIFLYLHILRFKVRKTVCFRNKVRILAVPGECFLARFH